MAKQQDKAGHEHAASALAPLDRARFDALLDDLVTACAPRLFAIVVECHDLTDGAIVGWGMAFEERVFARIDEGPIFHMQSLDTVLQVLRHAPGQRQDHRL
jgi:hypothetical protein